MTYFSFCNELKIRDKGEVEHHIIPVSVQKEMLGYVFAEETIKCTPQSHLYAHILYDRENNKSTRRGLWGSFSRKDEVNWETCTYEDLEGFDEDWELRNQKISEANRGCLKSEGWKQKLSEAMKGRPKSEETKRKMSSSHKGKHAGEKNPSYSKRMYNNGVENHWYIPGTEPEGYVLGRLRKQPNFEERRLY